MASTSLYIKGLGFRVQGLAFRLVLAFVFCTSTRASTSLNIEGLGFRVEGLG